jgi:hypothetical protein
LALGKRVASEKTAIAVSATISPTPSTVLSLSKSSARRGLKV